MKNARVSMEALTRFMQLHFPKTYLKVSKRLTGFDSCNRVVDVCHFQVDHTFITHLNIFISSRWLRYSEAYLV